MTPEQFAYWLQGFVEIADADSLSDEHWQIIKDHLATVFVKETPNRKAKENRAKEIDEQTSEIMKKIKEMDQYRPYIPAPYKPEYPKDDFYLRGVTC